MIDILRAESPDHFQSVRELITEFFAWDLQTTTSLGFDAALMDYQYSAEGLQLPGDFAPPEGCFLLATYDGQPAGCAAFRQFAPGICELKRMYVRPQFRGHGIARKLVETLVDEARQRNYSMMYLETTTFMQHAQALYHSLGFYNVEPYYQIPEALLPMTVFLERKLTSHD
jgi:GNAT superfamily N-acetyltransferase